MKSRVVFTLAAVLWASSILGALVASNEEIAESIESPDRPRRSAMFRGVALNMHRTDKPERYVNAVDDLVDLGAESVLVIVPMFQEHGGSMEIAVDHPQAPRMASVVAVLQRAQRRGLRTVLMPVVLFEKPRSNEWRGRIMPENWDHWWGSYTRAMEYYAQLGAVHGVDVLSVGSELNSTETQRERWCGLIAQVRERFYGPLIYSANWDRYARVSFWSDLDYIGISAWFEISRDDSPDLATLRNQWRAVAEPIVALAAKVDRPFVFTEIGYPTVPWALKDPWNYIPEDGTAPDHEAQQRGLEAFFGAWHSDAESFPGYHGFFLYEWDIFRNGGPDDFGYGVRGKPAHETVRTWFDRIR